MTARTLMVCGLVMVFGSGCFLWKDRFRKPISPDAIVQITPGETTIADVDSILGSPNAIIWSNGVTTPVDINQGSGIVNTFVAEGEALFVRAYHYRHTVHKGSLFTVIVFSMRSEDIKYDQVFVFFDDEGKVTHVGSSLNSQDASYCPFSS